MVCGAGLKSSWNLFDAGDNTGLSSIGLLEALPLIIPSIQIMLRTRKFLKNYPPDIVVCLYLFLFKLYFNLMIRTLLVFFLFCEVSSPRYELALSIPLTQRTFTIQLIPLWKSHGPNKGPSSLRRSGLEVWSL